MHWLLFTYFLCECTIVMTNQWAHDSDDKPKKKKEKKKKAERVCERKWKKNKYIYILGTSVDEYCSCPHRFCSKILLKVCRTVKHCLMSERMVVEIIKCYMNSIQPLCCFLSLQFSLLADSRQSQQLQIDIRASSTRDRDLTCRQLIRTKWYEHQLHTIMSLMTRNEANNCTVSQIHEITTF